MTSNRDRILQRAVKLLAMRDDEGASQGEIENAARMLGKLAAEHGFTELDIRKASTTVTEEEWATSHKRPPLWARWLVAEVCEAMRCRCVWFWGASIARVHVIGEEVQAALARYFIATIGPNLWKCYCREAKEAVDSGAKRTGNHKQWRDAWLLGFTYRIGERLKEQYKDALDSLEEEQASAARALILVRDGALKDYMDTHYPSLGTFGKYNDQGFDSGAYEQGRYAADKVGLTEGLRGDQDRQARLTGGDA